MRSAVLCFSSGKKTRNVLDVSEERCSKVKHWELLRNGEPAEWDINTDYADASRVMSNQTAQPRW
jgi:hypothetical protein